MLNKSEDLPLQNTDSCPRGKDTVTMLQSYLQHTLSVRKVALLLCGATALCVCAQNTTAQLDTAKVYALDEVVVTENFRSSETRATAPLQILSEKSLQKINALQVSDAVKYFSGITVKDYGGVGGLKTVSVRSLGAAHTAVSYDGMVLSDCQSGQIDIGRFSLDNVDMLSLVNGQSDRIFQPARLFASAAVLNISTLAPVFEDRSVSGQVRMKAGSFGMLNPSALLNVRMGKRLSLSASCEWLSSNGEYPYLLQYGESGIDSVSRETRKNTDVRNLRAEATLYGKFAHNQSAYLKAYYYQSERGLPGATIFYNSAGFSAQRLWDRTFFTQGHYEKAFGNKWNLQANGKYNYGYVRYLDPTALTESGKEENTYRQREYYLSVSALYKVLTNLSLSLSTDGFVNTLDADLSDFVYPVRYNWLTALAAKYVNEWVLATASVLATVVNETVRTGTAGADYCRFSPYAGVSVKPFQKIDFRLRAFYKNIFRMPTFNDLYYSRVGNPDLKPETTNQYNVGLTYMVQAGRVVPLISLTVDAYHNDVRNKIVAYPTKNIYTWTMLNYGKVSINGVDLTGEMSVFPWKRIGLVLGGTYTYLRALNVTTPESRDYKHQIPYTPRVSGSGKVSLETPWVDISYALLWSGKRYAVNQNYAENRVPGYVDHSISASHDFKLGKTVLRVNAECLNVSNKNYEVVRYFPMPGRSWRATLMWKF